MEGSEDLEGCPGESELLQAIKHHNAALSSTLSTLQKLFSGTTVEGFIEEGVSTLVTGISLYANTFKRCNVLSRSAFEDMVKKYFRNLHLQEAFDELLENERRWNMFLEDCDKQFSRQSNAALTVGNQLPLDLPLTDVVSGCTEPLHAYLSGKSVLLVLLRHFA